MKRTTALERRANRLVRSYAERLRPQFQDQKVYVSFVGSPYWHDAFWDRRGDVFRLRCCRRSRPYNSNRRPAWVHLRFPGMAMCPNWSWKVEGEVSHL